jgi:hypothetical protein
MERCLRSSLSINEKARSLVILPNLKIDETGSCVSIGANNFVDNLDPAVAASYEEAVDSLCAKRTEESYSS